MLAIYQRVEFKPLADPMGKSKNPQEPKASRELQIARLRVFYGDGNPEKDERRPVKKYSG